MAWRIARRAHADLTGSGARMAGGRWNTPGRPMLYTASTPELAILEIRVHLDIPPEMVPDDYVLMEIDLTGLTVEEVAEPPEDPAAFGDAWLQQLRTPILRVPSFILSETTNLLLNPAHPDANRASLAGMRNFAFDRRLWLPL